MYWFGYSYITCENWLIRIPCIFFIKNNSPKYTNMNRVYLVCVSVMRVLLRLIWDFLFFRNGIWFEINYVHIRYITFNPIIRKLINTNRNTKRIFSSVNFRGILPTEIFPRYIPRELQWEKKIKTKQKKWWRVIFTNGITDGINSLVNCEQCSSCQLQRESPTEFPIGIFQRTPELFTFQLHY